VNDGSADGRVDPAIRCSQCAAACCRLKVAVMPDDKIPAWLLDHDDRGMPILAKAESGWCAALDQDTMRCMIYRQRPTICRDFAMGGDDCRAVRSAWFGGS
jgi:Fe-S-cluster containining protein